MTYAFFWPGTLLDLITGWKITGWKSSFVTMLRGPPKLLILRVDEVLTTPSAALWPQPNLWVPPLRMIVGVDV